MRKLFVLLMLICGGIFQSSAQLLLPAEKLFEEGRIKFQEKNYVAAQHLLKRYAQTGVGEGHQEETAYMLACMAYELKDPEQAKLLRDYLEDYPDSPHSNKIYSLLAAICFFDKDYDEAIALYRSCRLEDLPAAERDEATFRLAVAYEQVGLYKEAAIWFLTLQESSEMHRTEVIYHLAYINYRRQQYDAALQGFLSLQEEKEYAGIVPYYIAELYLLKRNYDKAEIVAQNFLSAFPSHECTPEIKRILGQAEYGMKQYEKAIGPLAEYIGITGKDASREVLYELGMSYFFVNAFSEAARTLERITGLEDKLAQNAWYHIGLSYLGLADKHKARMAFEQAAAESFDLHLKEQALYNYALCVHETAYSPFAESVKVFEKFLNEFPASAYAPQISEYLTEVYLTTRSYEAALLSIAKIGHPDARILGAKQKILFRLGTQAFADADFPKASGYFEEALRLGRYDAATKAGTYFWLAETSYRLENYQAAERNYRLALEFLPSSSSDTYLLTLYGLGYIAFNRKDYPAALNWFGKYVASAETYKTGSSEEKSILKTLADVYSRIGDCSFYARDFAAARQYYSLAVKTDSSQGDYALYQEAFVLGLQKDYIGKVQALTKFVALYPASPYFLNALYERGRAYVQLEDRSRAIGAFEEVLEKNHESPLARKAAVEIALLHYQADNYHDAAEAYKKVITDYPGSEEAKLAMRDLKSVYIDLNKVEEYINFASSLPGNREVDVTEKDSLMYAAAEKIYMTGEVYAARQSLERYLEGFPDGAFSTDAYYYLGLIDYNKKNYSRALEHFSEVLRYPANKFSEEASVYSATILSEEGEYTRALDIYKQLRKNASIPERRQEAAIGILHCVRQIGEATEIIEAATDVLGNNKLSSELANEARYARAKAYLSGENVTAALDDLTKLSEDTRNLYGAEAKYLLARFYFDKGELEKSEKEILDYIDRSTPHAYWLARSFILLSDVYVKMDRRLDAKQYLLSLRENYTAEDDIDSMIEQRLDALKD